MGLTLSNLVRSASLRRVGSLPRGFFGFPFPYCAFIIAQVLEFVKGFLKLFSKIFSELFYFASRNERFGFPPPLNCTFIIAYFVEFVKGFFTTFLLNGFRRFFRKFRGLGSDPTGFEPVPFVACRGFPFSPLDIMYYTTDPEKSQALFEKFLKKFSISIR